MKFYITTHYTHYLLCAMYRVNMYFLCTSGPDYGIGIVGKCLGLTTSKGPSKDGCKLI